MENSWDNRGQSGIIGGDMTSMDDLPPYLYCDDAGCDLRHFLTLTRDVQGRYAVAYTTGELCALRGLVMNRATANEAVEQMQAVLKGEVPGDDERDDSRLHA